MGDYEMGVWVDGKLRLISKDRDKIDEYSARRMRERHEVWVAPNSLAGYLSN